MQHLQIAYDLGVILIGFTALAIVGFWAVKTKETDLRNFWVLYASFTLVLVIAMLKKYLSLNVEGYSPKAWFLISGVYQVVSCAVLVAGIHYLVGIYQIAAGRIITLIFLSTMLTCAVLLFAPIGARLVADQTIIYFGTGFKVVAVWYLISFTFIMLVGFGFARRVWATERKRFLIGLLIFITIGYGETLLDFPQNWRISSITLTKENDFLFSSIPYVIYGIFLINYFLRHPLPTPLDADSLSDTILSKYGITGREQEIILMVMQGKSNADIAGELFISLATVKTHLHNIYQKMDVNSRYDLLARVRSEQ